MNWRSIWQWVQRVTVEAIAPTYAAAYRWRFTKKVEVAITPEVKRETARSRSTMELYEAFLPPWRLLLPFILAMLVICLQSFFYGTHRYVTPLFWCLAASSVGGMIGFLFCLPRVSQRAKPEGGVANDVIANNANRYDLGINDNLVQISDWLCKIIIGLGLIELRKFPDYLTEMSTTLAHDMGQPGFRSLAGALLIFFSLYGFVFGYIMTRVVLTKLFSQADRDAIGGQFATLKDVAQIEQKAEQLKSNMGKQLQKIQKEIDIKELKDLEDQVLELNKKFRSYRKPPLGTGDANSEVSMPDQVQYTKAVERLQSAFKKYAHRRQTAVILANAYLLKDEDFESAIRVCVESLAAMKDKSPANATDIAALNYNIAAYYCMWAYEGEPPTTDRIALTFKYLELALPNSDQTLQMVQNDLEFEKLRKLPAFAELITKYKKQSPA